MVSINREVCKLLRHLFTIFLWLLLLEKVEEEVESLAERHNERHKVGMSPEHFFPVLVCIIGMDLESEDNHVDAAEEKAPAHE